MTTTSWSEARLAAMLVPTSPAPMMTTCMGTTRYPTLKFVTIDVVASSAASAYESPPTPASAIALNDEGSAHSFRPETVRCGNGIEIPSSSNRSLTAFT